MHFNLGRQVIPPDMDNFSYVALTLVEGDDIYTVYDFITYCVVAAICTVKKNNILYLNEFGPVYDFDDYQGIQNVLSNDPDDTVTFYQHTVQLGTVDVMQTFVPSDYAEPIRQFIDGVPLDNIMCSGDCMNLLREANSIGFMIASSIIRHVIVFGYNRYSIVEDSLPAQKWDMDTWADRAGYNSIAEAGEDFYTIEWNNLIQEKPSLYKIAEYVSFSIKTLPDSLMGFDYDIIDSYISDIAIGAYDYKHLLYTKALDFIVGEVRSLNRLHIKTKKYGWMRTWHRLPGLNGIRLAED